MKSINNWLVAAGCCAVLAACGNPQQDWEAARLTDTRQAYADFLEAHPQSAYTERAQTRIAELEREAAWMDAQQAATATAYSEFLDRYPDGAHSRDAQQRIDDLARQAAWDSLRAQDAMSPEELRRFVASYPLSAEANQARAMMEALEDDEVAGAEGDTASDGEQADERAGEIGSGDEGGSPPPPVDGDFRVQLGAFGKQETADAERERLQQAHGDVLGAVVVEGTETTPRLYRVRSAPMTRELADDTCSALGNEGQACIVVAR